jgi:hypothetical protein
MATRFIHTADWQIGKPFGVGTIFAMHHGHRYVADTPVQAACVGKEHVAVTLSNSYGFRWEQIGTYFLEVRVSLPGAGSSSPPKYSHSA